MKKLFKNIIQIIISVSISYAICYLLARFLSEIGALIIVSIAVLYLSFLVDKILNFKYELFTRKEEVDNEGIKE